MHSIAQIPPVSKIYFNFTNCFAHGRDSENVLDHGNFNQYNRIDTFTSKITV